MSLVYDCRRKGSVRPQRGRNKGAVWSVSRQTHASGGGVMLAAVCRSIHVPDPSSECCRQGGVVLDRMDSQRVIRSLHSQQRTLCNR